MVKKLDIWLRNTLRTGNQYFLAGVLLCMTGFSLAGQGQGKAAVSASNITTFTSKDGLPICTGDVFVGPENRLYITTCGVVELEDKVALYAFDGYQTVMIPFHAILGNENAIPIFEGINDQGELFGLFHEQGALRESIFFFNPENDQLRLYSLKDQLGEKGMVRKVVYHPEYGYFILAVDKKNYSLFKWEDSGFQNIASIPWKKDPFSPGAFIRPILFPQKDAIWFWEGKNSSFWKYDLVEHRFQEFEKRVSHPPVTGYLTINGLVENKNGDVFLSYLKYGVCFEKLDKSSDRFIPFLPVSAPPKSYDGTFDNLFIDQAGNVLVKKPTDDDFSVWLLIEQESGKIYDYSRVLREFQEKLPDARASIKLVKGDDFRRNLLVTATGGIGMIELKPFEAIRPFSTGGTRGIVELGPDQFLIKSEHQHFLVLDAKAGVLRPCSTTKHACIADTLYSNLADFPSDGHGNIFLPVGEKSTSLLRYNLQSHQCDLLNVGIPFFRCALVDDHLIALVHQNTSDLYYYDLSTKQLIPATVGDSVLHFAASIFQMKKLSDGYLWAGTDNGLWRVNLKNNEAIKPHENLPFQQDNIYCIDEGSNGDLWLGTGSGGVQIYNPISGSLRIIDESRGLASNTAIAILKDEEGIRWINTYNGINLIDSTGKFLIRLYAEDGLASNEGNRFSSLAASDGRLLFGSVSGTTLIHPKLVKQQYISKSELQVFLSQLSYFDQNLGKDTTRNLRLNHSFSLTLPAAQRYLKVRVALSEYQGIQENRFAYRLEWPGKENASEWVFLGNRPELILTNLPAGKYDLVIRGTDYRGRESTTNVRISIQAKEFFYKETWFYILLVLVLSAFPILWLVRERFERKRLQQLVQERTKKIEEDKSLIEAQAEQLKSLDQAKSRFFTNISHEFRTPLTVISGMAEQIRDAERVKKLIQRNANHLLELINQILDLRKLESGNLHTRSMLGDVVKYMRYILESFQSLASGKSIQLKFSASQEVRRLDYDPEKLLRIVSNLLTNALKFTPPGGEVSIALEFFEAATPPYYQIRVADTGIGIAPEKLPQIFDRFYQVDDAPSREGEGTGIGLALTRELVLLLKGNINVDSVPGRGTTFTVQLPLTQKADPVESIPDIPTAQAVPEKRSHNGQVADQPGDLPSLLIVEDNPDVMEYLITCLEEDYQLLFAADGQEGIDQAIESIPDLIVSDVMMPRVDGFTLCHTLKTDDRTSHIPIVLLTAKADIESRIAGLQRGADAYLAKPFDKRELGITLQNLLSLRQRLQARYQNLENAPPPTADVGIQQQDIFITTLKEIFEERMEDPQFDLDALSREMLLSRSQLGRKVKALTGKAPAIFLRTLRLQKARQLLLTTDLSVKEVAYDVGFSDSSYFSRSYAEEFGENPSETGPK
ncbi:MAG: response regulator [Lewinellaceae bacterium]|nr:response regulator [Lewinellaceae bacterium]